MKKERSPVVVVSLLWVCLCLSVVSSRDAGADEGADLMARVPRVSASVAYTIYKSGKALMVDTMAAHNYKKSHILGSINLPYDGRKDLERIKRMRLPFPKQQMILVYCK